MGESEHISSRASLSTLITDSSAIAWKKRGEKKHQREEWGRMRRRGMEGGVKLQKVTAGCKMEEGSWDPVEIKKAQRWERRQKGSMPEEEAKNWLGCRRRGEAEEQRGETISTTTSLSLSCSISCLGHHVLRHPATTASPLHTHTLGERKREGGNRGGREEGDAYTHTHAHLAATNRQGKPFRGRNEA